ncbi:MAG TPA: hypothetical protein VIG47_04680 [Gemmatimonadaceae bacterium]
MDKDIVAAMIIGIVAICVTTILPLSIVYLRRGERVKNQQQLPLPDILARLERMELGMESMAGELERIGEGQRFTTKLLQTSSAWGARALEQNNNAQRSE